MSINKVTSLKTLSSKTTQRGVTLLELMITVAIIGIIASVAYPSYQEFVMSSRRADGQATLMSFASAVERHFTINDSYVGIASGALPSAPAPSVFASEAPVDSNDKYYDLRVTVLTASTFTLSAVPKNAQSGDSCGTLTLTHTGARGAGGSDCWP